MFRRAMLPPSSGCQSQEDHEKTGVVLTVIALLQEYNLVSITAVQLYY